MRALSLLFAIVVSMSPAALSQKLPTPEAITDPRLIVSKPNANVDQSQESLSIEKLYMAHQVGGATWSPDGNTIAFITNISGRDNLWLVPSAGGWPTQLTVSDQRQAAPAWSPTGKWIAYMSDYDGDEQWDIFMVSPKTGQVVNLTKTREISEESPVWSPDGRYLAYTVKPKTSSVYEIDVYDTILRDVKHVTTGTPADKLNGDPKWSRDGKFIAYTQSQAKGTDSNIFITELKTGTSILLTPHQGESLYQANDFSPDGTHLLLTSNAGNGYENAGLLDIASKKIEWLTEDKWEVQGASFSPDGKHVVWTANVEGNIGLYLHDLAAHGTNALPLPAGVNEPGAQPSSFSADGSFYLYSHTGAGEPGDLWVYQVADGKSRQVTHSLVAGTRSEDMVEPQLVRFPSKDGKWTISAWVYVPYNMRRTGQNAAIVWVHGGPAYQSFNGFSPLLQHLINQGYMIIAPNYRGSTGYGKDFEKANLFDMGGGDLEDVVAAADFIKQSGFLDPKKVALMGRSYGGYLTMMGLVKQPEVWAAGVPIVPFVNWFTELQNEDPVLHEIDLATMGDPEKNKDLYRDRSPIFFVDRISAPVLLLAGGNDPRCPQTETQQVVEAIKKKGGTVESKIYENEGHSFARVENNIDAYKRVTSFLKAHVQPADCGCTLP